MRKEMSEGQFCVPEVIKKDAEVMAGMCCTGTEHCLSQCGDLEPVKDVGELLREETNKYRERIQKMELTLKSSGVKVRAVHKINLGLLEELSTLRRLCVAVDMERRDAKMRLEMEGQMVKTMMKQLKQAKAKIKRRETEVTELDFVSGDHDHDYRQSSRASVPTACIRQPRAQRSDPAADHFDSSASGDFRGPGCEGHGDGMLSRQSD